MTHPTSHSNWKLSLSLVVITGWLLWVIRKRRRSTSAAALSPPRLRSKAPSPLPLRPEESNHHHQPHHHHGNGTTTTADASTATGNELLIRQPHGSSSTTTPTTTTTSHPPIGTLPPTTTTTPSGSTGPSPMKPPRSRLGFSGRKTSGVGLNKMVKQRRSLSDGVSSEVLEQVRRRNR